MLSSLLNNVINFGNVVNKKFDGVTKEPTGNNNFNFK